MSRWIQVTLLAGAMLLAGVVLLVLAVDHHRSLPQNVIVRPPGQEVHYDDFAFAVLGSREAPELLAAGASPPSGRFVAVRFRVANHARRVDFRFRPERMRLVDEGEAEFPVSAGGTAALREMEADGCAQALAPGTTCATELVFDVPAAANGLRARVGSDARILDMLDRVLYGKQFLDLD